jgi:hypothetical protein
MFDVLAYLYHFWGHAVRCACIFISIYLDIFNFLQIDQIFMLEGYLPPAYHLCWLSRIASTYESLLAGLPNRQQKYIYAGGQEPPI